MGEQGVPLVKKWTALGKLDFSRSEEDALSSGYILQNYWNLLEAEFKPKRVPTEIHACSFRYIQ